MWRRIAWWLRRKDLERELEEELRSHLAIEALQRVEEGATDQEAVEAARRVFGNQTRIAENTREAWGISMLDGALRDIRFAFRAIRRNPGYAATAILCLGLGIGVNTTVFSWLDELYFRQLPVPEAERLVSITRSGGPALTWRRFLAVRTQLQSLSGTAAVIPQNTFLDVNSVNAQIYAEVVSANYFDVLHVSVQLGRAFGALEDSPATEPVAILSDSAWHRYFSADRGTIGKIVRVEDQPYRIVGIADAGFRGASAPLAVDVWVPLATFPHHRTELRSNPAALGPPVFLMGRLAAGSHRGQAEAELKLLDARLPLPPGAPARNPLVVRPIAGYTWADGQRGAKPLALMLSAVAGTVLLIACFNIANLLLARRAARQHEISVRRSLGASSGQLFRQTLLEGTVLALGGALLGLVLGYFSNRALIAILPTLHPDFEHNLLHLEMNARVAFCTAAVSLLCAVLFSITPALESIRTTIAPSLQGAAPRGRFTRWTQRDLLLVAQVTLSLVLLVCAILLVRSLRAAQETDPGFESANRIYIRLFTPENDFTVQQAAALFSRLLNDARTLPGVRDATLSLGVFGFMDGDCASTTATGEPKLLKINVIEPNYFQFVGTPLLDGRIFAPADRTGAPRVIVVNQSMARLWWPGEDPVGKAAWLGCGDPRTRIRAEVIGLVRDSKYGSLDEQPLPFYFVHWRQVWWNGFFALAVRTEGAPERVADDLAQLARTGGPELRIYETRTFAELLDLSLVQAKVEAFLLLLFGALAIALAAVGLYGVVAYLVSQRTREMGIRIALGARPRQVGALIVAQSLRLTLVGVALGLVLSLFAAYALRSFLFGISPFDATSFGIAGAAWIVVAMLASAIPARSAARVDPSETLRCD